MSIYTVNLKPLSMELIPSGDRRKIYEAGKIRNLTFQRKLEEFLERYKLRTEVTYISQPTFLPNITLQCTERVVKAIETFSDLKDDIEFIVQESKDIVLIQ